MRLEILISMLVSGILITAVSYARNNVDGMLLSIFIMISSALGIAFLLL